MLVEDHNQDMGIYFRERWEFAEGKCMESLNDHDIAAMEKVQNCDEFIKSIEKLHQRFVEMSATTVINQLNPCLGPLTAFLTVLAACMGSTPVNTAILWGLLSLTVQAASAMSTVLPDTIDMLNILGHNLEVIQILECSFENNSNLGQELIEIFVELITFWLKAVRFLNRNTDTTALLHWPEVRKDFEVLSERITVRSNRIKEKAHATAAASSTPAALLQLLHFQGPRDSSINKQVGHMRGTFRQRDNLPHARNPRFFGRDQELALIDDCLAKEYSSRGVKSFALWGLGGIGKTQIALAYAHKQLDDGIQVILWVNCETGLSIARSFAELAAMLDLPGALKDNSSDHNRLLVLDWLHYAVQSWLLILDNVEDNKLARDCWPLARQGSILVTSKRHIVAIDPAAKGTQINSFSIKDGSTLLLRLVDRYPYNEQEVSSAEQLSEELGGHGLALGVMAAQVHLRRKSFTEFFDFYRRNKVRLHKETSGIKSQYPGSLVTCWYTAFETLSTESYTILGILSFIGPDDIPAALFSRTRSRPYPELSRFFEDEMMFDDALAALLDTSLVSRDPATRNLYIHRLIQYEFRSRMSSTEKQDCFQAAFDLLYEAFPKQINGWSLRNEGDRCKQHIQHVLILCSQWQMYRFKPRVLGDFELFTKLLANAAWYTGMESGAWNEEFEIVETAFATCEDLNVLDYAHLCNTHGAVNIERGNSGTARKLLETALRIRKECLGDDHPETGHTYNNIGNVVLQAYAEPTAAADAVPYYLKAIEIFWQRAPEIEKKKSGYLPMLNISRALRMMNKYEEALKYLAMAEESINTTFPKGNHFNAYVKLYRANIMYDQGEVTEAEKLWRQAFKIFRAESETSPSTISVELKLACLDMRVGKISSAIKTLKRLQIACKQREKDKGDKCETARVTRKLAEAIGLSGCKEEESRLIDVAEKMRKEIQQSREWQLPDEEQSYNILVWNALW